MLLGEFSRARQLIILKLINKEDFIEYNNLKDKINKLKSNELTSKLLFKTFHLDSALWDLVELGLLETGYYPPKDSFFYSITELGKNFLEIEIFKNRE